LERFCARLEAIVRKVGDTRAEEVAYRRFFRNPKVKAKEILATAAARTAAAAADRHVLLIQDTSEINYQDKAGRKRNLGLVGNGSDVGLFIHPVLVVEADGPPDILGLGGASIWRRTKIKADNYQSQPIETKESYRWIEAILAARAALSLTPVATMVADRESDIYEVFTRVPKAGPDGTRTHVLVRCHHDRALGDNGGRLSATVEAWPEAGRAAFDLDARPGRSARTVTLAVRFGEVTLRQPKVGADPRDPAVIPLRLVEVREVDPPAGATPVHWRLYTTHHVENLEQALVIVELYRRRWLIEQVFRTLKSDGLDVEQSLLADGEALENLAATALIAAVRVMQCVQARGEAGQTIPALRVFTEQDTPVLTALVRKLEGKTEKQKNPHPAASLAWAVWVIARLGGWKGYASERPPGPITIRDGLARYDAIAEGFALANL
jgi:hypothetical protein